jgi:hypothetical protein
MGAVRRPADRVFPLRRAGHSAVRRPMSPRQKARPAHGRAVVRELCRVAVRTAGASLPAAHPEDVGAALTRAVEPAELPDLTNILDEIVAISNYVLDPLFNGRAYRPRKAAPRAIC